MSYQHVVRPLERNDLSQLVELCEEHAHYERSPWVQRERQAGLTSLFFGEQRAHCWVINGTNELAGFASAALQLSTWDAGHYLYLDCLFLREAYRGRGLGVQLMSQVIQAAETLGALHLQWQTPSWNESALRFYQRLGAHSVDKKRFTLALPNAGDLQTVSACGEPAQ